MKVTFVTLDDWQALYIDGELYDQNHSLGEGSVLSALSEYGLFELDAFEVNEAYAEIGLPETAEEIPESEKVLY